jgi:hypothetical protein
MNLIRGKTDAVRYWEIILEMWRLHGPTQIGFRAESLIGKRLACAINKISEIDLQGNKVSRNLILRRL